MNVEDHIRQIFDADEDTPVTFVEGDARMTALMSQQSPDGITIAVGTREGEGPIVVQMLLMCPHEAQKMVNAIEQGLVAIREIRLLEARQTLTERLMRVPPPQGDPS